MTPVNNETIIPAHAYYRKEGTIMKKAAIYIGLAFAFAISVTPAYAFGVKARLADKDGDDDDRKPLLQRVFKTNSRAAIGSCTVTAINGTTLTCTESGKPAYTIQTDSSSHLRRRFWGKADLTEIQVNDVINVIGKWQDAGKTTILATLIRDTSIQKRFGVFFGTVSSVSANGWVMATIKRGNQTVTVTSSTKFTDRKEGTISQSDVAVGHRVRVRGLWDNKNNTVTAVTHVKDFDLPVKPTVTPKPTP
jgi:hypothetical protein